MKNAMSQEDMVLDYLFEHGSITSLEAFLNFGITRLAAAIWKLRHQRGLTIKSENVSGVTRFGAQSVYTRYWLEVDK